MRTIAALLIVGLWASGGFAQPAKSDGPQRASPCDSVIGSWISTVDPIGGVIITATGTEVVSIVARNRFLAAGLFQGNDLVALTRPAADPAPGRPLRIGFLRAHVSGDAMEVELADSLGGPVTARERWRRKPPPPGPVTPPADQLPKLGEYVNVEELPEAIEKVRPEYPSSVGGIEGTVLVQALLGKDGRVLQTVVVKSIPALDGYALAAVKQWRFKPAMTKGEPVSVWVAVPVRFPPP